MPRTGECMSAPPRSDSLRPTLQIQAHRRTGPKIPSGLEQRVWARVWSTEQARSLRSVTEFPCPAIQASLDRLSSTEADFFNIQGAECQHCAPTELGVSKQASESRSARLPVSRRAACV